MEHNSYRFFVQRVLLVFTAAAALVLAFFWFDASEYATAEAVTNVLSRFENYAPLIFISVYVVATICLVPGTALTLIAGVLFGPWYGTVYTVVGASLGAIGAFLIARFIRGPIQKTTSVHRFAKVLEKYDAMLANNGLVTMFLLRLIPVVPFSALNYGLGFSRVRTQDYMITTTIGIIPGTFAYTFFGNSLVSLVWWQVALAVGLIIVLVAISKCLVRFLKTNQ